jgi:adenine-specific DNA-methyltransferase
MPAKKKPAAYKAVVTLKHDEAKRKNIPTAEHQSVVREDDTTPRPLRYPRNTDLDPQLVWRGKDEQDWSELVVHAPPLYIQEKVHPKVLIDDLRRESVASEKWLVTSGQTPATSHQTLFTDLFSDFNGIPAGADKTDFYHHDQNWSNRMILGDSLQVMASLAEREGLRGKVQCIYLDPPYGIKFNSNFQWSTTSRDVKDGNTDHITREPEQVKAFRDTWRDGIHSYLTYLRDRLTVARDLLTDSGSIFVQIGDENVHRVRAVMDEIFGDMNCAGQIAFKTTTGAGSFAGGTDVLANVVNHILWYCRDKERIKYRQLYQSKALDGIGGNAYTRIQEPSGQRRSATGEELAEIPDKYRIFRADNLTSQTTRTGQTTVFPVEVNGTRFTPNKGGWKTNRLGMDRVQKADRLIGLGNTLSYVRFFEDFRVFPFNNQWDDLYADKDDHRELSADGSVVHIRPMNAIAHEMGHALLGFDDPFNVGFENAVRRQAREERRDYYDRKNEVPSISNNYIGTYKYDTHTPLGVQDRPLDMITWTGLAFQVSKQTALFRAKWDYCCEKNK